MFLKNTMSSHDRIMCTMDHAEPDHVPLYFLLQKSGELYDKRSGFTFGNILRYDVRKPYSYGHHIERVENMLALGLDDTLRLEPPLGYAEEYIVEGVKNLKIKIKKYFSEDRKEELLEKKYDTPEGQLKQVAQKTGDWPHGDNIPVFSDYSVSRTKEFLIKSYEDLKPLKYLLGEPRKEEYKKFKEESGELKKAAKKLGVVLEGGRTCLGESLVWLLGMQNMIFGTYDNPDFIVSLLDMLLNWEQKRLEMMLEEGIEIVFHSAWYEITDFWTPEMYRKILKPRISKLIKVTKEANVKFGYIMTKSFHELAGDLLDMKIDCLFGVDPVQGDADLKALKQMFAGKVCMWGGINSAVTLGRGTKKEIETAVENAIRTLAPGGGFVLYPVDVILPDANPWKNVEILIDRWKEIGSYPLAL